MGGVGGGTDTSERVIESLFEDKSHASCVENVYIWYWVYPHPHLLGCLSLGSLALCAVREILSVRGTRLEVCVCVCVW